MRVSKKIFLAIAGIFLILLSYVSYDISRKTTFPGSKPQLRERLKKEFKTGKDSSDSLNPKIP
jgi:hypothetical protein